MTKQRVNCNGKGETLVETIVAFAVLMILLVMVTTAIRAGIALNNHAIARVAETEAAAALVETGAGARKGSGKITVTAPNGLDQAQIGIVAYEAGGDVKLRYFKAGN